MSASLVVLLPVILLGIVTLLCFTGCGLDLKGTGLPVFTKYSDTTVLADPAAVAYWPLSETSDSLPAADRTSPSPNNGHYIDPTTLPASYPWPAFSINNTPGPNIESAGALGTGACAQAGMCPGDAVQPANDSTKRTPCLVVNGCYVNVPFNAKINPKPSFTLEAWVRVDWDKGAPHAWRAVLAARDFNPCTGFGIIARADDSKPGVYHWMAVIGNGGTGAAGFTFGT